MLLSPANRHRDHRISLPASQKDTKESVPNQLGIKYLYRRATGLSEVIKSDRLKDTLIRRPGEIDSLEDAIDDDAVRIHRPLDAQNIQIFKIYGGRNHFGDFNRQTMDFVKTTIKGSREEEFDGNVASLNANTINGRFWLDSEERTVAFNEDKGADLTPNQKSLLAWSLNEYINGRSGALRLSGIPLRSRQGSLKRIFITHVRRTN